MTVPLLKEYHLFLSSTPDHPFGYMGSFETIEAAELTLPALNSTIAVPQIDGSLFETQDDGSLSKVRHYLWQPHCGPKWMARELEPGRMGYNYKIDTRLRVA